MKKWPGLWAWKTRLGTRLRFGREGPIIGVVKNFHFQSLYTAIEPLIILLSPTRTEYLFVRIAAGQTAEAIAGIERVFKKFNADSAFEFSFQDEQFESMYRTESTMGTLATFFAIFAIFISCLGLFGLASYTAEQRTKEIGIRKCSRRVYSPSRHSAFQRVHQAGCHLLCAGRPAGLSLYDRVVK